MHASSCLLARENFPLSSRKLARDTYVGRRDASPALAAGFRGILEWTLGIPWHPRMTGARKRRLTSLASSAVWDNDRDRQSTTSKSQNDPFIKIMCANSFRDSSESNHPIKFDSLCMFVSHRIWFNQISICNEAASNEAWVFPYMPCGMLGPHCAGDELPPARCVGTRARSGCDFETNLWTTGVAVAVITQG